MSAKNEERRAEIEGKLHAFVGGTLMGGQAPDLTRTTPLLDLGVLDSMNTIKLLAFIDQDMSISIPLEVVLPDDLTDISAIATLVLRHS